MSEAPPPQTTIILGQPKSMGVTLILTILFGPLGLLYASVAGGLILIVFGVVVGLFTLGIGAVLAWVLSIIWGMIAVRNHNAKLAKQASRA